MRCCGRRRGVGGSAFRSLVFVPRRARQDVVKAQGIVTTMLAPSETASVLQDGGTGVKLVWSSIRPPAFPSPHQYQPCYCEENVYLLIETLGAQLAISNVADGTDYLPQWDVRAVFISNEAKTTLLYAQKASKMPPEAGSPVVWDYHVVTAVSCTLLTATGKRLDTRTWIYDADSTLSTSQQSALTPIPIETYINATFAPAIRMAREDFWPCFRLVPANDFLATFASDRSHMRSELTWHSPPPSWPLIRGSESQSANNLMSCFVDIRSPFHGGPSDPRLGVTCDCNTLASLEWSYEQSVPGSTLSGLAEKRKAPSMEHASSQVGGRVSSSLFPAYLHAVQQHRAHTPDDLTDSVTTL